MKKFFKEAYKEPVPVEALIKRLEMRLDNLVYRGGFGLTLRQSRQMVNHGLVQVNGKRVDIPSYRVKPGDTLTLKTGNAHYERVRENGVHLSVPYLSYNENEMTIQVERVPQREEIPIQIQDHLVTEFYTKML
jgi:small subunit ribosomal protein S4